MRPGEAADAMPLAAGPAAALEAGRATAAAFAAAVRDGDEQALGLAVRQHLPRLVRYVTRLSRDPGLAEDIAQESLVRAVLACRRGRPPERLEPWLLRVATNLWRDFARTAERRRTSPGLPAEVADTADRLAAADEAEAVRRALGHLPRELRAVLVLRYFEGLELREIAAITGAPPGTVKWRLFTALRRMRGLLGRDTGAAEEGQA